jgi:OmpA-OmpF porin, OOP family
MKRHLPAILSLAALVPLSALAQPTSPESTSTRMPYQKEFWSTGHAGIELGSARLDIDCPPGASCDNRQNAFKVFGGGRFNNIFGGEVSYLKTNSFQRPGGDLDLQAVNFAVLAGIPFGPSRNSSVFAKAGALWGHTEAGSESQNGWGPSFGLGATIGITRSWAARLDWDRYRFKLPGGGGDRENLDTFMIGAQYTFGNPR